MNLDKIHPPWATPPQKLARILTEFPWLWAIRPYWRAEHERIFVRTATNKLLSECFESLGIFWNRSNGMWIKICGRNYDEVLVVNLPRSPNKPKPLYRLVIDTLEVNGHGEKVEYIAFDGTARYSVDYTIYRPPREQNLVDMCRNLVGKVSSKATP